MDDSVADAADEAGAASMLLQSVMSQSRSGGGRMRAAAGWSRAAVGSEQDCRRAALPSSLPCPLRPWQLTSSIECGQMRGKEAVESVHAATGNSSIRGIGRKARERWQSVSRRAAAKRSEAASRSRLHSSAFATTSTHTLSSSACEQGEQLLHAASGLAARERSC